MSMSSSSSDDFNQERQRSVEVIMPEARNVIEGAIVGDVGSATGSSATPDEASIIAAAIAKLPADQQEQAKDPKRKARSNDPGWKYGFWPDVNKKESVKCIFCKKVVPAGIGRFKQHLAGGFTDVEKCPQAHAMVRADILAYIRRKSKTVLPDYEQEGNEAEEPEEIEEVEAVEPSARTKRARTGTGAGTKSNKGKRTQASISNYVVSAPPKPQTQKQSKSVSSLLCKTPEQVVEERHRCKHSQSTLEYSTKTKEAKQIVADHIADFFYENAIPFNVINSRSWEIMVESIGQYGPGLRSPTYHDLRNPLLERAVEKTKDMRKKHEDAWKEYGCTIMSDGWTDTSHRHLINFLANSPAGTFFLGSVDASSEVANANLLADLLEKQINLVGKEYVVQIVTDNGSNFKSAGRILMDRVPTLFWTPCAAHCLDLMMEDIGKITDFSTCINLAKKVSRFIYKHGKILDLMRDKIGGDLVRPAVTRFATSYLTLASMHKNRLGLKNLFVSEDWQQHNLSRGPEGRLVEKAVLSMAFWTKVENCIRASQPLLVALRIADGDETPAAPEIMAAMDVAKSTIKESLKQKPQLLDQVLSCYDKRWDTQMEQKLYGAALFLNPAKYFAIRENDRRRATRLRSMFNDVLWKMVIDEEEQNKISKQADDYERTEGECFTKELAIRDRNKKNPILWWGAYGGLAYELQSLAKRVVSLCCSASGCERNWSTFAHVHTKKRNRLEHKRLSRLVYVSYNRMMTNRFKKIRELGSKGKKSNPLLLEEFQWDNEWVDINSEQAQLADGNDEGLSWALVDEACGASQNLRGRNLPRAAAARAQAQTSSAMQTYGRKRRCPRKEVEEVEGGDELDGDGDEAAPGEDGRGPTTMEEDEDSGGPRDEGFQVDDDLLS